MISVIRFFLPDISFVRNLTFYTVAVQMKSMFFVIKEGLHLWILHGKLTCAVGLAPCSSNTTRLPKLIFTDYLLLVLFQNSFHGDIHISNLASPCILDTGITICFNLGPWPLAISRPSHSVASVDQHSPGASIRTVNSPPPHATTPYNRPYL